MDKIRKLLLFGGAKSAPVSPQKDRLPNVGSATPSPPRRQPSRRASMANIPVEVEDGMTQDECDYFSSVAHVIQRVPSMGNGVLRPPQLPSPALPDIRAQPSSPQQRHFGTSGSTGNTTSRAPPRSASGELTARAVAASSSAMDRSVTTSGDFSHLLAAHHLGEGETLSRQTSGSPSLSRSPSILNAQSATPSGGGFPGTRSPPQGSCPTSPHVSAHTRSPADSPPVSQPITPAVFAPPSASQRNRRGSLPLMDAEQTANMLAAMPAATSPKARIYRHSSLSRDAMGAYAAQAYAAHGAQDASKLALAAANAAPTVVETPSLPWPPQPAQAPGSHYRRRSMVVGTSTGMTGQQLEEMERLSTSGADSNSGAQLTAEPRAPAAERARKAPQRSPSTLSRSSMLMLEHQANAAYRSQSPAKTEEDPYANLVASPPNSDPRLSFLKDFAKAQDRYANLGKGLRERASVDVEVEPPTLTLPSKQDKARALVESSGKLSLQMANIQAAARRSDSPDSLQRSPTLSSSEGCKGGGSPSMSMMKRSPTVARAALEASSDPYSSSDTAGVQMLALNVSTPAPLRLDGTPQKIQWEVGVSVKYLVAYARKIASTTAGGPGPDGLPAWCVSTAEVVKSFVMPQTASLRCKLADLIPREYLFAPTLYISHAHAGSFAGLVAAIVRFCTDKGLPLATTSMFLDVFCLNHHTTGMLPSCMGVMQQTLDGCKQFLLVVDHKGAALSRLWCMYEAWLATISAKADAAANAVVGTAVGPGTFGKFQVIYDHVSLDAIQDGFAAMDQDRLAVTIPRDRQAIELQAAGLAGADGHGLGSMLAAVQAAMQAVAQQNFQNALTVKVLLRSRYLEAAMCNAATLVLVGLPWDAEQALRQALLWAKKNSVPAADMVTIMTNLALLLKADGYYDEAERLCSEALNRDVDTVWKVPRVHGEESLPNHMVLLIWADVVYRRKDFLRAKVLCEALLKLANATNGKGIMVARAVSLPSRHMANILIADGLLAKGEALLWDCLAMVLENCGAETAEAAECQYALGLCLEAAGKLSASRDMLTKCTKIREYIFGDSHALTLEARVAVAGLLIHSEQHDAAEKLLGHVYVLAERTLGTLHVVTQEARMHFMVLRDQLLHLGQTACEVRADVKAEGLLRRALHINSMVLGEASEVAILHELLQTLRQQGKTDEVKVVTRQLHEAQRLAINESRIAAGAGRASTGGNGTPQKALKMAVKAAM